MLEIRDFYRETDLSSSITLAELTDFLHTYLEQYGDSKTDITHAIEHALGRTGMTGGFILLGYDQNELVGALVMNGTGMTGYIPAQVLVYVAVKADRRGKGYGRALVQKAMELSGGAVKLHVEYENPAKKLYEALGFVNKYADMRWSKG